MGKQKNCLLAFRIPATKKGFDLVEQMRKTLNKDSYKMRTLFTGKRPQGHTPYTLKKDAESIRVYIDSKMPVSKPSDEEARSLYMEGFNKGKAKSKEWSPYHTEVRKQLREREDEVEQLKKEVEEQAKRIDNSPSYNRLKVENEQMQEEIIALNKSLATAHGDIVTYTKLLSKEMDTNKKLEENIDAKSKSVSRNSHEFVMDRIVDDAFDKWVAQKPWHKRWLYKLGSVSWRDFAMSIFAFWTISMIVLLVLKVEGVWVS